LRKRHHNSGQQSGHTSHLRIKVRVAMHVIVCMYPKIPIVKAGLEFTHTLPLWAVSLKYVSDMHDLTTRSHPEMIKLYAHSGGPRIDHETVPDPPAPQHPPPQPWISVVESEIVDKSKGDMLGKLVAVLQTTWFFVEFLGRWANCSYGTPREIMFTGVLSTAA